MAWENYKVEQQRLRVVQAYLSGHSTMTSICKQYGISRKTAYKWCKRFLELGEEGLLDLSKAPHCPNQYYTDEQIERLLDYKPKHLRYGPKKVLVKIQEKYPDEIWPSATRTYEIFKDYHLVTKRRIKGRIPETALLGILSACNSTWAVDFKGWFLTADGCRFEPLTMTDVFSRYLLRCTQLEKHTLEYVWPIFDEAFREYGLPDRVRSDNGPPFGCIGAGRLTHLSINLIKAGVIPEWIRPGHPEDNGRHERFHLTLKQYLASPPKETLALQIDALIQFQEEYNFERPHEALNIKTPSSIYHTSSRRWDGILRPPEYNRKEMDVRKVGQSGSICIKQKDYYIGQSLTGDYVGLKTSESEELDLYYGPIYLGKLNNEKLEKPKVKMRRQR